MKLNKKRKIAVFIQDFNGGGAERMMINLANGMAKKGRSVDLLVVRSKGPFKELVNDDVQIIPLKSKKVLLSIPELSSYLKKEKPSVLYSTLKHVNIAAIIANKIAGNNTKTVIREACHLLSSGNNQILQKIAYRFVPFFYRRADTVVAVSEGVANSIMAYCKIPLEDIFILSNPSVTDELIKKSRLVPEHPFFKNNNSKVVLGVGRLTYQKNFDNLIKAFLIMSKNLDENLKLIILGEGEDRKALQKQIDSLGMNHQISLPGFVDNPYSFMKKASLFVLSSRFEGSPNVLVEAMACGTPVVSTDCPSGPKQILKEGMFGLLVPVDDYKKLSDAMIKSIQLENNEEHIKKLQKRAMDYHVDQSVEEYLGIYKNI